MTSEVTQADQELAHRIVTEWRPKGWPAKEAELAKLIARHRLTAQSGEGRKLFCETCGDDVHEVLCPKCAKWWEDNSPSEGRSGAGPHNVDANGKPTDDSDPWFQLGWYKDRLERAETERDIWKERAMSLRIASRKAGLLQTALEDICDPVAALRRYADERGRQLDGAAAFQLANDPNHIKGIARAALRATDDAGGA